MTLQSGSDGDRGGPAAIRGFRLQALYVLHLLLDRPGDLMRPEGIEDVDVLHDGKLVEVCQIKALSGGLALSDLDPDKPDGFFRRCIRLTDEQPAVGIRIVTYDRYTRSSAASVLAAPMLTRSWIG